MLLLWMKKKKGLIFVMFHVLFDFCEVSHTRGHKNQRKLKNLILWNFIYPGSWKLEKIEAFDFCEVSCTQGHENWRKLKNLIFVKFRVRSWKLEEIEAFEFCEISSTRVHESWRKLKHFDFCEVLSTRGHKNQRKLKNLIFVIFLKCYKWWLNDTATEKVSAFAS